MKIHVTETTTSIAKEQQQNNIYRTNDCYVRKSTAATEQ